MKTLDEIRKELREAYDADPIKFLEEKALDSLFFAKSDNEYRDAVQNLILIQALK